MSFQKKSTLGIQDEKINDAALNPEIKDEKKVTKTFHLYPYEVEYLKKAMDLAALNPSAIFHSALKIYINTHPL